MAQASRDENRIPTLLGVSSADGTTPVTLFADPTTHRLYVDLAAGGTVTVDAGTTTTLAPGASATVVNSGTTTDAVFDFGIPAGEKGDPGDPGPTGPVGMVWKDAYVGATAYVVNDAVSYNGSSYICILNSTGNLPTDTTYWSLVAQKGSDGIGTGDMLASDYDPTNVADDAFDMDNMVEGTNNKLVSSAEKTAWNDKLDDITGESIADLSDVDTIVGITDGKVLKWDTNKFVVADDNDTTYTATDFDIKDLTDSTNLRTTWSGKQDALGFTPEDVDNKRTSFQATPDDTHYPSEKLVKESLDAKANANNVLALDNTTAFTPDNDYEPATKKYVDDNAGGTKAIFEDETITPTTFGWGLSTASYDSVSFSVSSQDTSPYGVTFKPDGTKMYIVGDANDKVFQYTLSTAWDLSTASYDSVDFSVSSQDGTPYGVTFKPDGTKMYIIGLANKKVFQYTLSTAWDLSTASYDSVDFSVSQDGTPLGVTFKPDGTKMYMVGETSDKVYQYTLSTAWDLSTASYDSVSFSVSSQDGNPRGITFKPDGTKMYIMGYDNEKVFQYTTAYDLSLAEIDTDTYGEYYLTAIANNTKISMTGTPTLGQTLFVGLKDAGTTKKLTWTGITALVGTLPTQTTPGKQHIIEIKYIGSAWRTIAVG